MRRLLTFLGAVVGIAGVVVPVLWDWYSRKSSLELRIESSTSLLQSDPLLKDILITYRGKPVKGLTRLDFTLVNSGRTPISSADVIDSPKVQFPPETEMIAAMVLKKDPENLSVNVDTSESPPVATVRFDLLNSTDYVQFAVYLSSVPRSKPVITSRIRQIKRIDVTDRTDEAFHPRKHRTYWVVYLVGAVTLVFVMIATAGTPEVLMAWRTKALLRKTPNFLESINTVDGFAEFVRTNLEYLGDNEKKKIGTELSGVGQEFTPESKAQLIRVITDIALKSNAALQALIFVLAVVALGAGYLVSQFAPGLN